MIVDRSYNEEMQRSESESDAVIRCSDAESFTHPMQRYGTLGNCCADMVQRYSVSVQLLHECGAALRSVWEQGHGHDATMRSLREQLHG